MSEPAESETPTQRQARLRREKRQQKFADSGEERLARIKALNGGVAPPEEVLGGPSSTSSAGVGAGVGGKNASGSAGDPEEVDISSAFGAGGAAAGAGQDEDPMAKMMQQVMGFMGQGGKSAAAAGGGGGGGEGAAQDGQEPAPEIPPMLKALMTGLGGGGAGADPQAATPAPPPTGSAYLWRVVHAVFAFGLASYIATESTFNGSKLGRSESAYGSSEPGGYGFGQRLVLMFCTAQLGLQSARYFVEKGQLQGGGVLASVANSGFIGEPWAGYVRQVGRYISILQTVFADVMVVVFVFGALAWWKGMADAKLE